MWTFSSIFKKPPKGQKFSKSGHPAWNHIGTYKLLTANSLAHFKNLF
jgi:hypothetical protein